MSLKLFGKSGRRGGPRGPGRKSSEFARSRCRKPAWQADLRDPSDLPDPPHEPSTWLCARFEAIHRSLDHFASFTATILARDPGLKPAGSRETSPELKPV
jgi:hypothetical protein